MGQTELEHSPEIWDRKMASAGAALLFSWLTLFPGEAVALGNLNVVAVRVTGDVSEIVVRPPMRISPRITSAMGITGAASDQDQLPNEQRGLDAYGYEQREREETSRVMRQPAPEGAIWLMLGGLLGGLLLGWGIGWLATR